MERLLQWKRIVQPFVESGGGASAGSADAGALNEPERASVGGGLGGALEEGPRQSRRRG